MPLKKSYALWEKSLLLPGGLCLPMLNVCFASVNIRSATWNVRSASVNIKNIGLQCLFSGMYVHLFSPQADRNHECLMKGDSRTGCI